MPADRSHVAENDRERARLRALVERLTDEHLRKKVNAEWTIAGVLAHAAFWDGRALVLAGKIERGEPFTESDDEPDDPTWINDGMRALLHAIPPREAAGTALRIAEEIDARIAAFTDAQVARTWPVDQRSPLNAKRASHRGEHLDEIEAALKGT
jgi:sulfite reductase beta subunit-like hemoprotein